MTADQWPELRVTDNDIDAPDEVASSAELTPPIEKRPSAPGIPLRWCATAAVLALVAAVGSALFVEHRGRTITTVSYQDSPVHTIDAGGCPHGDTCSPLQGLYGGLTEAIETHFPDAQSLFGNEMIDAGTDGVSRNIRIVQVSDSRITVAAVSQCRPDKSLPPSRDQGLTATGPTEVLVVRPTGPGCSIAVLAEVPAGVAVPQAELIALAEDDQAQPQ